MEMVKETKEYKVFKKKTGRYAVTTLKGKYINGADKTKILIGEKLIKAAMPAEKPAEEAPAEEAPAEESSAE